jgi:hypothetical protein
MHHRRAATVLVARSQRCSTNDLRDLLAFPWWDHMCIGKYSHEYRCEDRTLDTTGFRFDANMILTFKILRAPGKLGKFNLYRRAMCLSRGAEERDAHVFISV